MINLKHEKQIWSLTIIILFGILYPAYSQQYVPLLNPEAVWFETYTDYAWPPPPFWYTSAGRKYLEGDTIINDTFYKKIYHEQLDVYCTNNVLLGPNYFGAIREDELQKKVWYVVPTHSNELLYFDFSLSIGDSLSWDTFFGWNSPFIYLIISDIDTIVTFDGIERKRWLFDMDPWSDESFMIEGIGCSSGLLAPYEVLFEYANFLANFHIDTTLVYCSFIGCELPTDTCVTVAIGEKPLGSSVSLYPNPVTSGMPLTIVGFPQAIHEPINFELYDIMGIRLDAFIVVDSKIIFTAPAKPGYYIISLFNSGFIKQLKLDVR